MPMLIFENLSQKVEKIAVPVRQNETQYDV